MPSDFRIKSLDQVKNKKICNTCGFPNTKNAQKCKSCGKMRFAPNWVLVKRPLNRQVSVEITKSNPIFGDPVNRITLSKWWPGGNANFHIPNPAQWEKIKYIVENELAPILGWKTADTIVQKMMVKERPESIDIGVESLWKDHPDILKRIVEAVDPTSLSKEDFSQVVELLGEISNALTNANAGFRESFLAVVKKLPEQKKRAIEDLDLLLQGWSLQAITTVAQQVRSRIETIELFETQILDPRTHEITGDNSIHRILERAMWLVDERYWLLHSNSALRKFIGAQMSKQDKKRYGNKRPDFVCGSVGARLILLELKRPAHDLIINDLNQLETYLTIAEDYTEKYRSFEAYLVGNRVDPELARRMKHRSSAFKIMTYADIVDNTRERYKEFLEAIEA